MIRVLDARFLTTATNLEQCPKPSLPEIAFAGRSNVGKSSMINTLCGRKKLVRVSNTPGRTRTLNFFDVDLEVDKKRKRTFRLCDLPGYGYAKASKSERHQWQAMISDYLTKRSALVAVVAIVDAEVGPLDSDRALLGFLSEAPAGVLVAATKLDRVPTSKRAGRLSVVTQGLDVPAEAVVGFSAVERLGVDAVWDRLVGATLRSA
jgi:GTP-binding protein